jgi:hypothetical protein
MINYNILSQGTIQDTASAVIETTNATRNTIEIAKAAKETKNTAWFSQMVGAAIYWSFAGIMGEFK